MAKRESKLDSIMFKGKTIEGAYIRNSTYLLFRNKEGDLFMKYLFHNKKPFWERANFKTWSPRLFLSNRA